MSTKKTPEERRADAADRAARLKKGRATKAAQLAAYERQALTGPREAYIGHGSREIGGLYWQVTVSITQNYGKWHAFACWTIEARGLTDSQHGINRRGISGSSTASYMHDTPAKALADIRDTLTKTAADPDAADQDAASYACDMAERQIKIGELPSIGGKDE